MALIIMSQISNRISDINALKFVLISYIRLNYAIGIPDRKRQLLNLHIDIKY